MFTALTGLAAGALHVLSGPDHIAALAPLAVQNRRNAMRVGMFWGLGHGLGVLLLGGLGVVLGQVITLDVVSHFAELMVGLLLVLIGGWAIRSAFRLTVHTHNHDHGEGDHHGHLHVHMGEVDHTAPYAHRRHSHTALGVGLLHGVAGTGHIFGVLPAMALPPQAAGVYLAAYLVSAVSSMVIVAALLGRLAELGGQRSLRGLMVVCGLAAIGVGLIWTFQSVSTFV